MKLGFKSLLIIFLVALLGAGIGTYGVLQIGTNGKGLDSLQPLVVNQVNYDNKITGDYTSAINKAFDTVVEIYTKSKNNYFYYFGSSESTGAGSGVIISPDGYIVTNHHVIANAYEVTVKLTSGESFEAEVIGSDSRSDLALIKIDVKGLNYSNFTDSDKLVLGEEVIAIGNPLGEGITASNGIISALEKEIYLNNVYMDLMQTNASINEGNSGGGLFDLNGNLVGIINAKSSSGYSSTTVEGMGYAIPANRAIKIISNLKEYGFVKDRAALGIKVGSASSNSYIYRENNGLLITEVIEGGGAEKAGIQAYDLITEVDGVEVTSYAGLNRILEQHQVGDTVNVVVKRDNKTLSFEVTLTETINA